MRLVRRILFTCAFVIAAAASSNAGQSGWQAPAGRTQLSIWPNGAPDATPSTTPENDTTLSTDKQIAGRSVVRLGNVSTPTLTFYSPLGASTGATVIVFPGGGYHTLSMDLEATEVCDWLITRGVACALLKYRVPDSGPYPKSSAALQDAQRAVGLIRSRAEQLHIHPNRIGVLGFSAGGHLAVALSTHFEQRLYKPVDAADQTSCRPDFAVLIYPEYLTLAGPGFALDPDLRVTKDTPPTFIVQSEEDKIAHVESSLVYYRALKEQNVPAEMHLYTEGAHGYGLRATQLPVTGWPLLVEVWLHTIRMVPE